MHPIVALAAVIAGLFLLAAPRLSRRARRQYQVWSGFLTWPARKRLMLPLSVEVKHR